MSFAFIVSMMLLGSSVVIAFVLQPPKEESAASAVSHHRCQGESLQSVRKSLLRDLNLQTEPRLPAGALEGVRKQWKTAFRAVVGRTHDAAAASGYSVSPDDGNTSNRLKCCSMTSEVFMTDLGWDSWVIHPDSLTIVQCVLCSPAGNTVQCPSTHTNTQDASQVPCCQPTSQTMVPIVYMDELGTVIISSVQMTQSCGCEAGHAQQPFNSQ